MNKAKRFAHLMFSLLGQSMAAMIVLYIVVLFVMGSLLSLIEGIEMGKGLWFSAVTLTTTGYGDYTPASYAGKAIALVLMHFGPGFAFPVVTALMAAKLIVDRDAFTHDEQEAIQTKLDRVVAAVENK